jgi:hypothetical protein
MAADTTAVRSGPRRSNPRFYQSPGLACAALLALSVEPALADPQDKPVSGDPQALSVFVPVEVQDALVIPYGTMELQGLGVYTRDNHTAGGRNLFNMTPTLKLGAARGLQLDISAPYAVGDAAAANQGGATFDAIYNFNPPTPYFPALAIQPGYQTPDGPGHTSAQYFLRGMMTQWLGSDDRAPRLDLNVNWTHVAEPGRSARSDIMEVGIAYSRLVSERTALVIDLVHGAKPADRQVETIMDAGLRTEVIDDWYLSGGAGVGMGQQSPSFRLIFSVQRDFVLFGR